MKDGSQARYEEVAPPTRLYYHFDLLIRSVWSLVDTKEQDTV